MNGVEAINRIGKVTGVEYSDEQMNILMHKGGMCILACAGSGKALKNGTRVLTPNGYINIEALKVNDLVYSQDGKAHNVLGVYPQGRKQVYKLHLSDKTIIPCCKDHIWVYKTSNMRGTTKAWKTGTTKDLIDAGVNKCRDHCSKGGDTYSQESVYIPMTNPVEFSKKDIPIKPYTLGVILVGEYLHLSDSDDNIIDRVREEVKELGVTLNQKADTVDLISTCAGYGNTGKHGKLRAALDELGLVGKLNQNKFIPDVYKMSSVQDRLDLLNGIIDTAGKCKESGYEISLKSESLTDDIKFLCETLGIIAVKSDKIDNYMSTENGIHYNCEKVYIGPSELINKLHCTPVKDDSHVDECQTLAMRAIEYIEETNEFADMTCIMVDSPDHTFLTENCVVTHNTTVLSNLIAKRLLTNEIVSADTLLCTTYSKGGAEEMEQRIKKLLKQLGIHKNVAVKTMHALYLGVLKEFGYPSTIIDNKDRRRYILDACKDIEVVLDDEDFQTLDSLLSYQVNNLLSDHDLVHSYVFTLSDISVEQYSAIRQGYNKRKIQARVIDFDDMQLYMFSLMYQQNRTDIIDYCRRKWTDVYVDEAQDMSKIQYAILKKIIVDPNRFVLVGDDDQCIYQWRGADPSIILNICAEYDIKKFVLSTNYRCAGNIVDKAAVGIVHNSKRSNKSMRPCNPGGEIKVCDCGSTNLYIMSKYAYKHIKTLVVKDGISPSKIAVLSRNNAHLSILSNMLFKDGIHCEASNEMKMTKYSGYKSIKDVLELAGNGYNHNLTASTLYKVCTYLKRADAKRISDIQKDSGVKLSDVLGYLCTKYWGHSEINWNGKITIPALAEAKIMQSLAYLSRETIESIVLVYKLLIDKDTTRRVTGLLALFLTATEFMYRDNMDKKRTIDGLVDYITDLCITMGFDAVKQFLKVSEQYEEGRMAVPGPKVCMSTMHGAKGKEWDHVVLFADDNITFPSFSGIVRNIKNGVSQSDIYNSIDEDRRLHYVAMTRAKRNLAIFTDSSNVGVYLLEALGIFNFGKSVGDTFISANNAHIISMASSGKLYDTLLDGIKQVIFNDKSKYKYEIDISELSAKIEIDYLYRGSERGTISIDSIVTSKPEVLVD